MPLWWNNENSGTERWSGLFNCIFSCNEALKYLEDPSLETDYEKAQQDLMIAQAYALRAYCYLQLIKRWGGVPVLRESLGKDHDYSKDKRASFAQCVDFIIESCDKALAADEALAMAAAVVELWPSRTEPRRHLDCQVAGRALCCQPAVGRRLCRD